MLVTLFGIVTLTNPAFSNALCLILVTLSGIVILVKLLSSLNALTPILVTLSGIVILVKFLQRINKESWKAVILFDFDIVTLVNPVSPNAPVPMLVTLSGMTILERLVQPLKAE